MPTVDLVYDLECPHIVPARTRLMRAFSQAGVSAQWQEHRIGDPTSPERVRGFGSPTILVDGRDVAGAEPSAEASCRLYATGGAPSVEMITEALEHAAQKRVAAPNQKPRFKSMAAVLPGIGVAFLPKIVCPMCWPAYAAVLSATGLTFLMEDRWLFPISVVALVAALAAMSWRAEARRGYGPAILGLMAACLLLFGKFALESEVTMYGGIAILIAAAIWNVWPRRSPSPSCPACISQPQA